MKKAAWWMLTVCVWLIVFPVTVVTGIALMASGAITPAAGVVNLVAYLLGFNLNIVQLGMIHSDPWFGLLFTLVAGVVLFALGWLLWKATVSIHRWLIAIKPVQTQLQCLSCNHVF